MGNRNRRKLRRGFYARPTLTVAKELLGKALVDERIAIRRAVRIVEVEAYVGEDDPACHAAPGLTERNRVMYGPPGHAYIYLIYGMYHCLNVVTERKGFPAAILIRAAEPLEGRLEKNSRTGQPQQTDGPGKLCRALNLSLRLNGLDLTGSQLYLVDRGDCPVQIAASPRIGISSGQDKLWRFYDPTSPWVSNARKRTNAAQRASGNC
ncbi:MAG TPA: DNA-3-methyladenine glycosylase [candidate division Zixibacteria bacterium]|nr:DNA-3-methyladenine glycosylase [candidate division Zixibacteria bacterium]